MGSFTEEVDSILRDNEELGSMLNTKFDGAYYNPIRAALEELGERYNHDESLTRRELYLVMTALNDAYHAATGDTEPLYGTEYMTLIKGTFGRLEHLKYDPKEGKGLF